MPRRGTRRLRGLDFGDYALYAFAPHDSAEDLRIVQIALMSIHATILETYVPASGKWVLKFEPPDYDTSNLFAVRAAWETCRRLLGLHGDMPAACECEWGDDDDGDGHHEPITWEEEECGGDPYLGSVAGDD
jgi:hypothetical protein